MFVLRCRLEIVTLFIICLLRLEPVHAQSNISKQVNHQMQTWVSINSTYRISQRWGVLADFHTRQNGFAWDPNFLFLRFGANYWIKESMTAAAGYGHMWRPPARDEWSTWSNENRIYEQFLFNSKMGKTGITQRFRNEQRWQEIVVNDVKTGKISFTDRFRYLLSFNFPIFKKPGMPSLVLADEILIHFGKEVVFNTFDQNRLFIGIKQNLNKHLSFDFGYMNVYQQKYSGYQYDMNHTLRLFFYYNGGSYKGSHIKIPEHHDE